MNRLTINSIAIFLVGGVFVGCSYKNTQDVREQISDKRYTYTVSNMIHNVKDGKNLIFIDELLDGKKVRLVQKLVIYDKDIPKKITFDSCKSLRKIPVLEDSNDGYIELTNIDGKKKYFSNDCQSELTFTKDNSGIYLKGKIETITYLQYSKTNLKPFIPVTITTSLKRQALIDIK
ncbi:MAG: hypothetical protein HRT43_00280 [Campylobacteraceae bacterium]|nr:hypothetical protein [Campylobacteraceae bacterium]